MGNKLSGKRAYIHISQEKKGDLFERVCNNLLEKHFASVRPDIAD